MYKCIDTANILYYNVNINIMFAALPNTTNTKRRQNMTRAQAKTIAKSTISLKYWPIVGATLLIPLILAASTSIPIVGMAGYFFLTPLMMGLFLFYIELSKGNQSIVTDIFVNSFDQKYYLRRVGGFAWMLLFEFLWTLLFIIPGIIKSFSYALTPYILAKYPEVPAKDALKISMKLMNGRKFDLFILYLSFIGWELLSALTFGLLDIFFVFPYRMITVAVWAENVIETAIADGSFVYPGAQAH